MRLEQRSLMALLAALFVGACTSHQGTRVESVSAPDPEATIEFDARMQARTATRKQAQWAALPEREKSDVRAAASAFSTLPSDKQQELRAKFEALDDVTRRGYLLGPILGQAWPHLQPLFGYVPESQRGPVLAMLRDMNHEQLYALERLAWRTPVEERDAMRQRLLGMQAAQRNAWLFEQNL